MDLLHELSLAKELALQGGRLSLELRGGLTVRHKANNEGPVTNADIIIDNLICGELRRAFPDDVVIGEESYNTKNRIVLDKRTWLIDPIDGTASYVAGGDDFVVMIGLAINGKARLGVVYQPIADVLWYAIYADSSGDDLCEKMEDKRRSDLRIRSITSLPEDLAVIGSRTHHTWRHDALIRELKPKRILLTSSVGLKAMLVLERQADIYVAWSPRLKMWDTCAPYAIVMASGASMLFIDGRPISFLGSLEHGAPILITNFVPDHNLFALLSTIAGRKS